MYEPGMLSLDAVSCFLVMSVLLIILTELAVPLKEREGRMLSMRQGEQERDVQCKGFN